MIKKLALYYSFIIVTVFTLTGFLSATSIPQVVAAVLFFPLSIYFWSTVLPRTRKTLIIPEVIIPTPRTKKQKNLLPTEHPSGVPKAEGPESLLKGESESPRRTDKDRRAFLKLVASAGAGVFLLSIFTKKASAAFFGSVPGPGTVSLKDSTGTVIDPAISQPTDGYKIAQLDDSSPAYYGFTNKTGAWFIMKEGTSGDYRYTKGASDFSNVTTGWPNRAALSYDYFDVIF